MGSLPTSPADRAPVAAGGLDVIDRPVGAPLDITLTTRGAARVATIVLAGELDPSTTDRLRAVCRLARDHAAEVVVDLTGVSYCGAAGLRVLCEVESAARAAAVPCRFDHPSRPVRLVVDACGLGTHLTFA